MKLHDKTPDCAVHFLSGSLPGAALLHLRQLTLFGMISRLENSILRKIAVNVLVEGKPNCSSWFQQIRDICIQYLLPHPLTILESPPTKLAFKQLCKQRVTCFWRRKFQTDACKLTSLRYLKPEFISLASPHPIFTTLNGNPYQTKKAKVQSRFLSGRYRTEKLCRFWSKNNAGICLLESCKSDRIPEELEHIIFSCKGLAETRKRLLTFTFDYISDKPELQPIIHKYLGEAEVEFCQFIIDCSVQSLVISSYQLYGKSIHDHLFYITRTWCYSLHKERLRQLGRFNCD